MTKFILSSHIYSENEGSAGSRVDIYQKLQEKKQKQLAELKIIEEEIKQGKLGGPVSNNKLSTDGDNQVSLPRQPIPQVKKHINIDQNEWRISSPELCAGVSVESLLNDLNVISSTNIDDINNHKYTSNYDPIYNGFQIDSGANIPSLNKKNMSPISSQMSAAENHSLVRQIVPRSKIPHDAPRNPFPEAYRTNFPNMFADKFNNGNSINVRQLANSPNRIASISNSNNEDSNENINKKSNTSNVICDERGNSYIEQQQQQHQDQKHMQRQMQQAKTPEVLLAPHYLGDSNASFYDWEDQEQSAYRLKMQDSAADKKQNQRHIANNTNENLDDGNNVIHQNGYRIPSDIDSQVCSL